MGGQGVPESGFDAEGRVDPGSPVFAALHRLLALARSNTTQSRRAATFLLAWWYPKNWGGWELTELWLADEAVFQDMLTLMRFITRYPNHPATAFGLDDLLDGLFEQWRPHRRAGHA